MIERIPFANTAVRRVVHGTIEMLAWLGAAALGGSFVLGCGGGIGGGSSGPTATGPTMAISTGGQIRLYTDIGTLANNGSAPSAAQAISAPNVQSVAFDASGNLHYLANTGTPGSAATFHSCQRPSAGLPLADCTTVGSPVAGGQWLAIDNAGTAFVTALTSSSATVVSFPVASGPPATPMVVYTSNGIPAAYGGIAVNGGDTLYVTELAGTAAANKLFACATACQGTPGSQADLTAVITASNPHSVPGGPLAVGIDGTTLFVGAAAINDAAPLTLPAAFVCAPGGGGLGCQADNATFPGLFGVDNPFVTAVGIAPGHADEVYEAVLLKDGGDTSVNLGPEFFGFVAAGTQFACSGTPTTCRVNQLPSVPANSAPGSVAYGLAVAPVP